ncbi:hypothetical protein ASZ78_011145 [Callipepla squamata]|uniref:DUF4524 domain-containing protein n=1 Tax=Callipepla squamata TaxID=9009 RepID=A0A226MK10_CALSU|nr:hypothetical protein ASZ78_011145 [Callipepla squamata]
MAAERLMVLYGDDSVEVHYAGGARLLLSPCGSEYMYEEALPAAAHPLQPAETTRQRVPFVLSAYREQILRALDFRNAFSSRPYLPSRIIAPERKSILFSDILEVRWPDPVTADLKRCIKNGSVKISSVDGYAHLYLSELQQEFTVEFLCKVSQPSAASSHFSPKNSNYRTEDQCGKSSESSVPGMSSEQMRVGNKNNEHGHAEVKYRKATKPSNLRDRGGVPLFYTNSSSEYMWVTQRWSVSSCPEEWKYPLSLALMCYSLHTDENILKTCEENNRASTGADVLTDPRAYDAVSRLPAALPISCRAPHLHRFTHGRRNVAEIYPGDESLFKSEGDFLGNYFVHYAIQKGIKKREEKMYSVNSLPPDVPGSHYSISSIITEATKMLQYCYKTKLSLIHNYHLCCWKMVPETDGREMLPVLLDEKVVLGTGRLLVYSDHKVHAVFWDGISLNMVWDFSSCYTKIQVNEDVGWCKLTTPDGVQRLIQIRHPGIYERSADAELEKIQRFNSDRLLQFSFIQQNDWLRAFSDNAVHGILGMWSWAIVIGLRKKSDFTEVTLAGFLASVIDVDHFLLAGSLSLKLLDTQFAARYWLMIRKGEDNDYIIMCVN